jgi:hypothetical protein
MAQNRREEFRSPPAPDLILNCNGTRISLRKAQLLDKCELFLARPSLLGQTEYEVRTEINPSIFIDFIKFLQSETVEITAANFSGLSGLCSEFGFNELFSILADFQKFHPELSDCLSRFESGQRLCQLEELNFQLSGDVSLLLDEIGRLLSEFRAEIRKTDNLHQKVMGIQSQKRALEASLRQEIGKLQRKIRAQQDLVDRQPS